jgi:hypothetical protein
LSPKIQAATLYESTYSAETDAVIKRVEKLLTGMASIANAHDARFIVAMIPERNQVYIDEEAPHRALDLDKPQRIFAEFFTRSGIEYIDLLPAVRAAAARTDEELYYRRDSHFKAPGYRAVGEEIARYLTVHGALSGASGP